MDHRAAVRAVRRLARRAEITERISPHSLRYGFTVAALDAGVAYWSIARTRHRPVGARITGDCHVRSRESRGVRFP
jgi:integrase